jgi:predicted dehydrogenase
MPQSSFPSRRDFLLAASGVAAAAGTASPMAGAQIASIEPMKIGVFGLDYTFWSIWADLLSPKGRQLGTSVLRMRPTHVWDKNIKKAQDFANQWGCEVVERYDGMVGKVDAVVNGDLNNVPWQHLLMRPYLEAGMPCFLMRHWAGNLRQLDEMLDLAAKHSTAIMATVPFEHYAEADALAGRLKRIGEIQAVFATAQVTDEPHFHIPYMVMKVLGYDVDQVSMITDDVRRTGYLNINYVYAKTEKRRPFMASMSAARPENFSMTIVGDQGTISADMPTASSYYTRFFDQLLDMQRSFERRTQYQPPEVIRAKYQCLLAAYYSKIERNSSPVKVGSVPADWALPAWQPNWYDGSEFKR